MNTSRRPVIADVARRAGVSTMTVSRVLNGSPSVTDETRQRVKEAVAVLGYRVNSAARIMRGGRSRTLGVVAIETEQYGPSHTLFGVEAAARAAGHAVSFVTMPRPDRSALEETVDQLRAAHVDGVVVIAPFQPVADAAAALDGDLPVVVVGGDATPGVLTVAVDQKAGARVATQHLLELGHATVHHVGGVRNSIDARGRIAGWSAALRAARRSKGRMVRGDWSAAGGYAAGIELADDPTVTAIFAANDQMAIGVIRALVDRGRTVPGDVSVVGFDDAPESAYLLPSLTTVRQDFSELGRRAVEMLMARIDSRPSGPHSSVPPELVVRESTAPAARRR